MNDMSAEAWRTRAGPVKWPDLSEDGLRLRPATLADAERWFAIRAACGPWQAPLASVAAARALLADMEAEPPFTPGWRQFMLEEAGAIVGDIGFNWPAEGAIAEIGFEIDPAMRGRGLARSAVRMACSWLLGQRGLEAVIGICHGENRPACATLEAAGLALSADAALLSRFSVHPEEQLFVARRAADA